MTVSGTSQVMHAALGELGAVVLLDDELRICDASEQAVALVGPLPVGDRAPRLLCGTGTERPMADMLASGQAGQATIIRDGRAVRIVATPLEDEAGWLLRLSEDAPLLASTGSVEAYGILTQDPTMKRLLHIARRVAASDVSVLVRGETGTGKELLARAIHDMSARAKGPFQAINCAALSPTLLESELFGHVRGAFTGAVRDNPGHFRRASGGTLFLDEVAEMPPELQAKLLRVLETKSVVPVGSTDAVAVDVRIVAATHRSLRADVAAGRFRADLMYRLRKVPLFLPPLCKRKGDIELLAHRFVKELGQQGPRKIAQIASDAMTVLMGYSWPGNVRELANALEYAAVVGEGPTLVAGDLPPEIVDPQQSPDAWLTAPVNTSAGLPVAASPEAARIVAALEQSGGHKARAAKSLGLSRVTLWRRMKDLGLQTT